MEVEYELDQWEWQGTTRTIEIDPRDYAGLDAERIKQQVYQEIWRDAEQNLHFVYKEDEVAQEILEAVGQEDEDEDDD